MDNHNQAQMLLQIQQLEFVTLELNLFLDTHPNDRHALAMFNQVHKDLMQAVRNYEQIYGPLLNFGFSPNKQDCWKWTDSPWPWQI
ncbi:CotJB protein [Sporotomaculum syntrophicum]|uniref:CotJB protein n=1 Tax=Sporotomaculum syntrophicum TaxID=182264 RepID=A0A9D2WPU4_9FIRM|nr:spore coat protein CotJB [Sporotomaculum syntrophicum]KAF1085412.1 CotJB protein [Sporotomaculum syntrophicum]